VTEVAVAVGFFLLGAAAAFQGALALGAPLGRFAYGGRAATRDGRLPAPLRLASACTVLVLGVAAFFVHADAPAATWTFSGLFGANTAANLAGTHPVERWGMSAATLLLTGVFLVLSVT
jgi:hypothetical protein